MLIRGGLVIIVVSMVQGYLPPPLFYHGYDNMTLVLRSISVTNPHLVKLYSIGKSVEGRFLWVVEITANRDGIGLPYVKLVGNIHGNEPVGKEMLIHFIQFLVDQYNNENRKIMNLLETTKLHILPSLNPDGFEASSEGTCKLGPGRSNSNNIDLNRNFPEMARSEFDEKKKEEPETKSVIQWMQTYSFVLSASLHSGALVAGYPFDNYRVPSMRESDNGYSKTDDDDVFRHLALTYSEAHPTMYHGISCNPPHITTFPGGITNGAAWYPLSGGMQDYNYLYHGCMELTLEISCCKYPPAEQLPALWKENINSLLKFLGEANRGVKGLILDEKTGKGIAGAHVRIANRDMTFTTSQEGEYWRILIPGSYLLQVSAEGFINSSIHLVVPENHFTVNVTPIWLNITMRRPSSRGIQKNQNNAPNSRKGSDTWTKEFLHSASKQLSITHQLIILSYMFYLIIYIC